MGWRGWGGDQCLRWAVGFLASAPHFASMNMKTGGRERAGEHGHKQPPSRQPVPITKNPPPALPTAGASLGLENKHVTARPARRTAGAKNRQRL